MRCAYLAKLVVGVGKRRGLRMSVDTQVQRSWFEDVMVPCYSPMEMIPVRGQGSVVWDRRGERVH